MRTGALLQHFAEREEAAALKKLASQTLPGDEARWRDELFDTIAQLDRQVLQQRVAELQAKQRESGLDDADKTELPELLQAQNASCSMSRAQARARDLPPVLRSEARRVGKKYVSTC